MNGIRLYLLLLLACTSAPTAVQAQDVMRPTVEIEHGARIRLTTANQRSAGVAVAAGSDGEILIRRGDTLHRFSSGDLLVVEGRGGRDRGRGARWGGAVLAAITTTGAAVDVARGNVAAGELVSAFLSGALVGAGIGAILAPSGWVRMPEHVRIQVTGTPP